MADARFAFALSISSVFSVLESMKIVPALPAHAVPADVPPTALVVTFAGTDAKVT